MTNPASVEVLGQDDVNDPATLQMPQIPAALPLSTATIPAPLEPCGDVETPFTTQIIAGRLEKSVFAFSQDDMSYPVGDASNLHDLWSTTDTQFWLDDSDFTFSDICFDSTAFLESEDSYTPYQSLTTTMQDYFDRKYRKHSMPLSIGTKMWYSARPDVNAHDKTVVRVYLVLFRRHIPITFSLFDTPGDPSPGRADYVLAKAAVGGLFSSVPGSAEVAKTMYNDARRLLLASFNVRNSDVQPSSTSDKLLTVKTFILLSLYGLCSGDKRSYEFAEVFQANLNESVREYCNASPDSSRNLNVDVEQTQLLKALYILDCYRVIVMVRPPSLSWHHPNLVRPTTDSQNVLHLQKFVVGLVDRDQAVLQEWKEGYDLASLASLAVHVWPARFPSRNVYGADGSSSDDLQVDKADFAALACDNWLRFRSQAPDASHLSVYHMMNLMLHANLTVLQSFAHSYTLGGSQELNNSWVAREVRAWTCDEHYRIAQWHAQSLLTCLESSVSAASSRATDLQHPSHGPQQHRSSTTGEVRRLPYESLHVPYAIYYASLVLWCGDVCQKNPESAAVHMRAALIRGERLLSLHKMHVAQLLSRVLEEIK